MTIDIIIRTEDGRKNGPRKLLDMVFFIWRSQQMSCKDKWNTTHYKPLYSFPQSPIALGADEIQPSEIVSFTQWDLFAIRTIDRKELDEAVTVSQSFEAISDSFLIVPDEAHLALETVEMPHVSRSHHD